MKQYQSGKMGSYMPPQDSADPLLLGCQYANLRPELNHRQKLLINFNRQIDNLFGDGEKKTCPVTLRLNWKNRFIQPATRKIVPMLTIAPRIHNCTVTFY